MTHEPRAPEGRAALLTQRFLQYWLTTVFVD